jgi:hypothetical protein
MRLERGSRSVARARVGATADRGGSGEVGRRPLESLSGSRAHPSLEVRGLAVPGAAVALAAGDGENAPAVRAAPIAGSPYLGGLSRWLRGWIVRSDAS